MKRFGAVLAGALLLAGCTAAQEPAPPQQVAESTPTPTPAASSPATATENQVASIVAGIEPEMRKVIADAGNCRILHTVGPETAADEASLTACYAGEVLAGGSAKKAVGELAKLIPPASMQALVTDMIAALNAVANIDLEAKCGKPFSEISDSGECSYALGQRFTAYLDLEEELNKWTPYLT